MAAYAAIGCVPRRHDWHAARERRRRVERIAASERLNELINDMFGLRRPVGEPIDYHATYLDRGIKEREYAGRHLA